MIDVSRIHHLAEFETVARGRLSQATYGYVAGGAGLETSVSRNRESLDSLRLVPRVLRDVERLSTSTTLLGMPTGYPLILAPSAVQRIADPEGELATARAARDAGLTMVLSMNSSTTVEEVGAEGVSFWMQLYFSSDREHMKAVVEMAEAGGANALCVTVDHAGMPNRLRELHHPLEIPPEVTLAHTATDPSLRRIDRTMNWDVVEWLRSTSELPIVLKGILHPQDARIAADVGVDGIVVSNHGGRQLDGAVSSYDVLAPICDVVGGRLEVYADGGIRSGTDLLKVLALGARAGLVGRPVWWSLAAAGEAGVRRMIELLTTDFEEAMRFCGVADVAEVGRDFLLDA
jgi:4-hydroxymandelate oxidase